MLKNGLPLVGLTIGLVGVCLNGLSLFHIVKSFNIRTHVFTLVFIDALISTVACGLTSTMYLLVVVKLADASFFFCSLAFYSTYLPWLFGSLLTLMVAAVRFVLTRKSAENVQYSNSTILTKALSLLFTFVGIVLLYFSINTILNEPFAILIEACVAQTQVSIRKLYT
jgi:hypothetical protein